VSTPEPDHFHQLASLFADPVQHDHDVTRAASPRCSTVTVGSRRMRWRPTAPVGRQVVSHAGLMNGGHIPEHQEAVASHSAQTL
jgi:hypothetical protein